MKEASLHHRSSQSKTPPRLFACFTLEERGPKQSSMRVHSKKSFKKQEC